jgi:hypothetical protein
MRIIRFRERQIRRAKSMAGWFVHRHDRREQVSEAARFPCIDNAVEHSSGAPATGRQRLRWTDQIPHRRQRALDHRWGKGIEQSYDRSWTDRAQRRRPPGEVPTPEAPQPGRLELGAGPGRKIGDGVDWLVEGPHCASERRGLHTTFLAHDQAHYLDVYAIHWNYPTVRNVALLALAALLRYRTP